MRGASFTAVNYSLRPSKTIQRGLVFDGLRRLQEHVPWRDAMYIGLGSVWFTDFIQAHKTLGISRMISLEDNEIGFRRAEFNRPYRFVRVKRGKSFDLLPGIYETREFKVRPTILWLDYDSKFEEDVGDELRLAVEQARRNSVLLTTFDASERHYGVDPAQRLARLRELFGTLVPDDLRKRQLKGLGFAQTIATLTSDLMVSTAAGMFKEYPCVPAFQIVYQDKATMVTVGAVFPSRRTRETVQKCVRSDGWFGFPPEPVVAPHLTSREVSVLQAELPTSRLMTRRSVQALGFDLEEEQIRAFQAFYRYYPTFAQIMS